MSDSEQDDKQALSDEIAKRWDPERLLRTVAKRAGRGERLDEATRRRYEKRFGVDLGQVRVYSGEFAQEVTKAHSAEAVTIGGTGMILMGGSPDKSLATRSGEALLAHELTHVAQDERGMFRSSTSGGSHELGNDEQEAEAEATEQAVLRGDQGQDAQPSESEQQEAKQKRREAIIKRVLEMYAASQRAERLRNGPSRFSR